MAMQPALISSPPEMLTGVQPQFDAMQNSFLPYADQSNPSATLQMVDPSWGSDNVDQSSPQASLAPFDGQMPNTFTFTDFDFSLGH